MILLWGYKWIVLLGTFFLRLYVTLFSFWVQLVVCVVVWFGVLFVP